MRGRLSVVLILAASPGLVGCGRPAAEVRGRITCQGKPIVGSVVFSPKGENPGNTGPVAKAQTDEDGNYNLRLQTTGRHTVVVTPRDLKYPRERGEASHPCDLTPREVDVKPGDNEIAIELEVRKR